MTQETRINETPESVAIEQVNSQPRLQAGPQLAQANGSEQYSFTFSAESDRVTVTIHGLNGEITTYVTFTYGGQTYGPYLSYGTHVLYYHNNYNTSEFDLPIQIIIQDDNGSYTYNKTVRMPAWFTIPVWSWTESVSGLQSTPYQRQYHYQNLFSGQYITKIKNGDYNFRSVIWNDLVNIAYQTRMTAHGYWDDKFASIQQTRSKSKDEIAAYKFNSLVRNLSFDHTTWHWKTNSSIPGYLNRLQVAGKFDIYNARRSQTCRLATYILTTYAHDLGWIETIRDSFPEAQAVFITKGGPSITDTTQYRYAGHLWIGEIDGVVGVYYIQLRQNSDNEWAWVYFRNGWVLNSTAGRMYNVDSNAIQAIYVDSNGFYSPATHPKYRYRYAEDRYSYYADGWAKINDYWYEFDSDGYAYSCGWSNPIFFKDPNTSYGLLEGSLMINNIFYIGAYQPAGGLMWLRDNERTQTFRRAVLNESQLDSNSIGHWVNIYDLFNESVSAADRKKGWEYIRGGKRLQDGWDYIVDNKFDTSGRINVYPYTPPDERSYNYAWFYFKPNTPYKYPEATLGPTGLWFPYKTTTIKNGWNFDVQDEDGNKHTFYCTSTTVDYGGDYDEADYDWGECKSSRRADRWYKDGSTWWYCTGDATRDSKDDPWECSWYYGGWAYVTPDNGRSGWVYFDYGGYVDVSYMRSLGSTVSPPVITESTFKQKVLTKYKVVNGYSGGWAYVPSNGLNKSQKASSRKGNAVYSHTGWHSDPNGWWYCITTGSGGSAGTYYANGWKRITYYESGVKHDGHYFFSATGYVDYDYMDACFPYSDNYYGVPPATYEAASSATGSAWYFFSNAKVNQTEMDKFVGNRYPTANGLSTQIFEMVCRQRDSSCVDFDYMYSLVGHDVSRGISNSEFANLVAQNQSMQDWWGYIYALNGEYTGRTLEPKGVGLSDTELRSKYGFIPTTHDTELIIEGERIVNPDAIYANYFKYTYNSETHTPFTERAITWANSLNNHNTNMQLAAEVLQIGGRRDTEVRGSSRLRASGNVGRFLPAGDIAKVPSRQLGWYFVRFYLRNIARGDRAPGRHCETTAMLSPYASKQIIDTNLNIDGEALWIYGIAKVDAPERRVSSPAIANFNPNLTSYADLSHFGMRFLEATIYFNFEATKIKGESATAKVISELAFNILYNIAADGEHGTSKRLETELSLGLFTAILTHANPFDLNATYNPFGFSANAVRVLAIHLIANLNYLYNTYFDYKTLSIINTHFNITYNYGISLPYKNFTFKYLKDFLFYSYQINSPLLSMPIWKLNNEDDYYYNILNEFKNYNLRRIQIQDIIQYASDTVFRSMTINFTSAQYRLLADLNSIFSNVGIHIIKFYCINNYSKQFNFSSVIQIPTQIIKTYEIIGKQDLLVMTLLHNNINHCISENGQYPFMNIYQQCGNIEFNNYYFNYIIFSNFKILFFNKIYTAHFNIVGALLGNDIKAFTSKYYNHFSFIDLLIRMDIKKSFITQYQKYNFLTQINSYSIIPFTYFIKINNLLDGDILVISLTNMDSLKVINYNNLIPFASLRFNNINLQKNLIYNNEFILNYFSMINLKNHRILSYNNLFDINAIYQISINSKNIIYYDNIYNLLSMDIIRGNINYIYSYNQKFALNNINMIPFNRQIIYKIDTQFPFGIILFKNFINDNIIKWSNNIILTELNFQETIFKEVYKLNFTLPLNNMVLKNISNYLIYQNQINGIFSAMQVISSVYKENLTYDYTYLFNNILLKSLNHIIVNQYNNSLIFKNDKINVVIFKSIYQELINFDLNSISLINFKYMNLLSYEREFILDVIHLILIKNIYNINYNNEFNLNNISLLNFSHLLINNYNNYFNFQELTIIRNKTTYNVHFNSLKASTIMINIINQSTAIGYNPYLLLNNILLTSLKYSKILQYNNTFNLSPIILLTIASNLFIHFNDFEMNQISLKNYSNIIKLGYPRQLQFSYLSLISLNEYKLYQYGRNIIFNNLIILSSIYQRTISYFNNLKISGINLSALEFNIDLSYIKNLLLYSLTLKNYKFNLTHIYNDTVILSNLKILLNYYIKYLNFNNNILITQIVLQVLKYIQVQNFNSIIQLNNLLSKSVSYNRKQQFNINNEFMNLIIQPLDKNIIDKYRTSALLYNLTLQLYENYKRIGYGAKVLLSNASLASCINKYTNSYKNNIFIYSLSLNRLSYIIYNRFNNDALINNITLNPLQNLYLNIFRDLINFNNLTSHSLIKKQLNNYNTNINISNLLLHSLVFKNKNNYSDLIEVSNLTIHLLKQLNKQNFNMSINIYNLYMQSPINIKYNDFNMLSDIKNLTIWFTDAQYINSYLNNINIMNLTLRLVIIQNIARFNNKINASNVTLQQHQIYYYNLYDMNNTFMNLTLIKAYHTHLDQKFNNPLEFKNVVLIKFNVNSIQSYIPLLDPEVEAKDINLIKFVSNYRNNYLPSSIFSWVPLIHTMIATRQNYISTSYFKELELVRYNNKFRFVSLSEAIYKMLILSHIIHKVSGYYIDSVYYRPMDINRYLEATKDTYIFNSEICIYNVKNCMAVCIIPLTYSSNLEVIISVPWIYPIETPQGSAKWLVQQLYYTSQENTILYIN